MHILWAAVKIHWDLWKKNLLFFLFCSGIHSVDIPFRVFIALDNKIIKIIWTAIFFSFICLVGWNALFMNRKQYGSLFINSLHITWKIKVIWIKEWFCPCPFSRINKPQRLNSNYKIRLKCFTDCLYIKIMTELCFCEENNNVTLNIYDLLIRKSVLLMVDKKLIYMWPIEPIGTRTILCSRFEWIKLDENCVKYMSNKNMINFI